MNTPTPTPRTDAAWSATFDGAQMSAGKTARALRECSQQLEIELAAERVIVSRIWTQLGSPTYEQLKGRSIYDLIEELKTDRAEVEKWQSVAAQMTAEREHNANEAGRLRAEVERLRSDRDCEKRLRKDADEFRENAIERAERAEASLHAATEECTDVRLKWHAVMGTCAAKEDAIIESDEELARLRARAERAEADAERYRLVTLRQDAELAAERARLDSGQILLTVAGERVWHCGVDLRAAIDAGIKEGAK